MRDHLPRITNPVLEQHCTAYTYGPGTCDEALYGVRGRNLPQIPPPFGTIILQRHQQNSFSYPINRVNADDGNPASNQASMNGYKNISFFCFNLRGQTVLWLIYILYISNLL